VLEHGADAEIERPSRRGDLLLVPVDADGAFVGCVSPDSMLMSVDFPAPFSPNRT
jgi:hypothetical protein